jgi:hypothetical protein
MWQAAPVTARATSAPVLDGFACSCRWMSTCTFRRVSIGGIAPQMHKRGG